jgi:peptide/nickel transport system substrate-binding protein
MITLLRRRILTCLGVVVANLALPLAAAGQPAQGEAVVAWPVTLTPSWFDPSTAPPQITAFGMLYAVHDALLRPLPGQRIGNSLAESWTESADGRTYEFKLRRGLRFHNGDPLTAEDVKFSFERYQGAGAKALQERVQQVEMIDPLTVRFHLREPWTSSRSTAPRPRPPASSSRSGISRKSATRASRSTPSAQDPTGS